MPRISSTRIFLFPVFPATEMIAIPADSLDTTRVLRMYHKVVKAAARELSSNVKLRRDSRNSVSCRHSSYKYMRGHFINSMKSVSVHFFPLLFRFGVCNFVLYTCIDDVFA